MFHERCTDVGAQGEFKRYTNCCGSRTGAIAVLLFFTAALVVVGLAAWRQSGLHQSVGGGRGLACLQAGPATSWSCVAIRLFTVRRAISMRCVCISNSFTAARQFAAARGDATALIERIPRRAACCRLSSRGVETELTPWVA
ncbi:hypothetical protein DSL92_01965 [Billgrantia gudaonensis]|uniref:Uncharacterized protein n=1 Tax=Billgrantia gudaonensis TaxID=376427 RepID=A0A3S0QGD3_9GAMM|nr:hypothetical protein DSL92_01965 [Halomonas gudaonensis]